MSSIRVLVIAAAGLAASGAAAQTVQLTGGQTSVALDTPLLESAAGLTLSGVSGDVIVPGSLPGSVAFGINARDAAAPALPTTFEYTVGTLAPFSGAIEHSGSVFFNAGGVEVGDFTIGFDAARVGTLSGNASGFFVQSTVGIQAILFDIETPSALTADAGTLSIAADLLVSPELGAFLLAGGLSTVDLAGADVGDALVEGVSVPAPGAAAVFMLGGAVALRRRR